ncbi:MAG: hypothetical protein IKV03_02145 [Alphaproteobacteria bacterium]|jgi:sensor c-di-GMP phosphodiesterase-like protein|nr:hypothetical protein [Alphaproteobacteria bacterium]
MSHIKPITIGVFIATVGCFVVLFSEIQQKNIKTLATTQIKMQATCSLHQKRYLSISCQPDLTTAVCDHLPSKKCPEKKLKKLKNMTVHQSQVQHVKHVLNTPKQCQITIAIPPRGRPKITQIQIDKKIFKSQ